ncbi:hypothetical protein RRG08_046963 [Elysia crispata]|uniref:Uncharacterized protein n=1 Tax=Elysia crispata TaxID=231223 RepID=A0AAE1A891_9GAST|nr:hypothetical protein RRG08_046963 [Elysia crispata]
MSVRRSQARRNNIQICHRVAATHMRESNQDLARNVVSSHCITKLLIPLTLKARLKPGMKRPRDTEMDALPQQGPYRQTDIPAQGG